MVNMWHNLRDWWRLQYCKARLPAYIHGDLPPATRKRIARYLDASSACYAEYQRQRQLARDINALMPAPSARHVPTFDSIWSVVQAPADGAVRRTEKRQTVSYGLLMVLLLMALLAPMVWRTGGGAFVVPSQPSPIVLGQRLFLTGTPDRFIAPLQADVALSSTQASAERFAPQLLQNTPEPAGK